MNAATARRYLELFGHYLACIGGRITEWVLVLALAYLLYAAASWLLAH
jgi:hypothetical protein